MHKIKGRAEEKVGDKELLAQAQLTIGQWNLVTAPKNSFN